MKKIKKEESASVTTWPAGPLNELRVRVRRGMVKDIRANARDQKGDGPLIIDPRPSRKKDVPWFE